MDKQLIASELWAAAQLAPGEGIADGAQRIADILTRIDAERSKKAAAWFINVNDECDPDHPLYQQISKGFEGCLGTFPLFRSPTIPEGMALVPKSALEWLFGEEGEFEQDRPGKYWWRSKFRGLIAAAQGERNA